STKAKSPGSGAMSRPGVPHAPWRSRSARANRFTRISLNSKSERDKDGHLVPELDAADILIERNLDRDLDVERRPRPKRPVHSDRQEPAAGVGDRPSPLLVGPGVPVAEHDVGSHERSGIRFQPEAVPGRQLREE